MEEVKVIEERPSIGSRLLSPVASGQMNFPLVIVKENVGLSHVRRNEIWILPVSNDSQYNFGILQMEFVNEKKPLLNWVAGGTVAE
jgi:hypothetical protein